MPLPAHPDLRVEDAETVWDGRFPLERIRFRNRRFDGAWSGLRQWELWRRGRAAAILPYDPDADQVVLIEQFRLPALAAGLEPVVTELPAGLVDPGEDEPAAIRRELQEEAGLAADPVEPIGRFLLCSGGSDEVCALYVGRVTAPVAAGGFGLADEQEDIRLCPRPAEAAIADAFAGRIANVMTGLALFWLASQREALRARWRRRTAP